MTTYNWTISQCDRDLPSGFIRVAHWQCTRTDGELSSSVYSTCSFDGEVTTPYAEVTQEQVLGWCWENGVDKDAVEASIAESIEVLKNPVQASGTPW